MPSTPPDRPLKVGQEPGISRHEIVLSLVRSFVSQTPINAAVNVAAALCVIGILAKSVPAWLMAVWGISIVGPSLWQLRRWLKVRHRGLSSRAARLISNRAWRWALASGAVWGASVGFLPLITADERLALVTVVVAIAAGSATTLAALPAAARWFVSAALGPYFVYFLFSGTVAEAWIAALAVVFILALLASTGIVYRAHMAAIDAREAARAAIKEQRAAEAEWRTISDGADAFAYYDGEDKLVLWNKRYREVLGLEPEDLSRGMPWRKVLGKSFSAVPIERAQVAKCAATSTEWSTGNGWFSSQLRRHPSGAHVVTHTDVTQIKIREQRLIEMRNALEQARDRAEEGSRAKSNFLANMSHELRTPLNAIIGYAEFMIHMKQAGHGTEEFLLQAGYIRDAGRHLLEIVNDILDHARAEAGKIELVEEEVALTELVESAISFVKPRAEKSNLRLNVEGLSADRMVRADQRLLKQALLNLLGNAVKFSPQDGEVRIEISERKEGGFTLDIIDNGIGIEPNRLSDVLEPFGQADAMVAQRYGGTGLGLPLSRALVELHEGRLKLASEPGKGTVASIVLPAHRCLRQAAARGAERPGSTP